jgi:hypothetical protein
LVPVDQLFAGHDVSALHVMAACVMESPRAAIFEGGGAVVTVAEADEAAKSVPATRAAAAVNEATTREMRMMTPQ